MVTYGHFVSILINVTLSILMRVPGKACESQVALNLDQSSPAIDDHRGPSMTMAVSAAASPCKPPHHPRRRPCAPTASKTHHPLPKKPLRQLTNPLGSTQKQAEQCCPTPPKLPQSLHTSPPGICNRCCICKAGCVHGR